MGPEIGSGRYGKVRVAERRGAEGKKYAVKHILKENIKYEPYLLQQEMEILFKVDHPNIVKCIEAYQDTESYYLVMEYCEGGDLYSYL